MPENCSGKLYSHYEERFSEHGYSYKTLGWGSRETQFLRFKILADVANLSGKSVCDIGCGFGDLYSYLRELYGSIDYHGIDICPTLIEEAKRQYPEASFETRDILADPPAKKFDFVFASGVLSYRQENHLEYVQKMMKAMFDLCSEALAINFLSKYVDYELDKDFHFAPEEAFSNAMKLSRWVALKHNYPLYEFSLFIYRKPDPEKRP